MRTKMLVLPILLLLASGLHSDTIHIPSEYSTIQTGLNAAQTGDTVLVASGLYFENLIWPNTQGIKLLSEQGAVSTIIDGGNTGSVISVSSGTDTSTVIDGFTIQNGLNVNQGGGINLEGSATICNNIIHSCMAYTGGGIYCSGSNITVIESNSILWNKAEDQWNAYGGGIFATGPILILGNSITHNHAHATDPSPEMVLRGGIYVDSDDANVFGNQIMYNEALLDGAGIYSCGQSVTFQENQVLYNESTYGGAVGTDNNFGIFDVQASQISFNTGDGMWISTMQVVTIDNCTISDNTGHGVKVWGFSAVYVPQIHNCNIFGNAGYGVSANSNRWTDATYCWWGDPSGPGGVGPGSGDEISGYVLYDPWLTELGIESSSLSSPLRLSVFPNPFSSNAVASFELPSSELVTIQVFDLSGRMVEQVFDSMLEAGNQTIELDGSEWSPGIYLIRLNTGNSTISQRCILVR